MDSDHYVKVAFLGDVGCGKSSLIAQYISNTFESNRMPTIGACNATKPSTICNKELIFNIWDTAGQEKYRSISKMLYRDAKAVVIVFDITSRTSFLSLDSWHKSVQETAPSNVIEIFVGNKIDIDPALHQVTEAEAKEFAEKNRASLYFVSAKTGESLDLIFYEIGMKINCSVLKPGKDYEDDRDSSFFLSNNRPKIKRKKNDCC